MYHISYRSCFLGLLINIKYVQVIGLMIVWVYIKLENVNFSSYFVNKDMSSSFPYKTLKFEIHVLEYHLEGGVS